LNVTTALLCYYVVSAVADEVVSLSRNYCQQHGSFLFLLQKTRLKNEIWAWGLSPSKYVAQAAKNCEKHF
jgi:hypothetical protein